ncbi:MAG: hypothetical protein PHE24_04225 [Patescibacteria group bacterium]|nr:hypothetical protein [Patescibacteria group bacterium]
MKKIIALLALVIALIFILGVNFEHGSSLADFQDELFAKYNSGAAITPADIHRLESNRWISLAYFLAPNNMVVRQYCLIDLITNNPKNEKKIMSLADKIGSDHVWLEGYSYWLYTKPFLEKYQERFEAAEIKTFIKEIDSNFVKTAYLRGDKLYPAPFGDLRDVPLEDSLQNGTLSAEISIGIITKNNDVYYIKAAPLGFNMHTSEKDAEIKIANGWPENFAFYEGYDKKYKNFFLELLDMIDGRRLFSFLQ